MNKYRKKPVVIEALQLTKQNIREVYTFIYSEPDTKNPISSDRWYDYEGLVKAEGLKLKTLESDGETQTASIGDYIIKGIQGEFYPCKPDIFKATYDKVD